MKNYKIIICITFILVGPLYKTNIRGATKNTVTGSATNIFNEGLAAFIEEVDTNYPFFELKGIRKNWERCKRNLTEKVKQCRNNDDFYGLLDEARRYLRDSHIRFSNLKGEYSRGEVRYYPGISFLPAVDNQVVIMSRADEYTDKLPAGSTVTAIDGQKAREFLEKEAKKSWNEGGYFSSPQRARLYAYRIPLQGKKNDIHKITIIKDGKAETVTVVLPVRSRWGFERQPIEYNGIAPNEVVEIIPSELQNSINSGIKRAEEYLDKKWNERIAALSNSLLILAGVEQEQKQEQKEETEKVAFRSRSYEISGVVTNESGLPLSGVKISNWFPHGSMPQVKHTDQQGKFYFEHNRGYVIKAEKEGFAPEFYEFRDEYYSKRQAHSRKIVINLTIAMTLTEGCTIEGVISSKEEGKPIPNAQVWTELQAKDVSVGHSKYIIWRSDILTTDSKGRFRVEHVPDGSLRLGAEAKGFTEASTQYYIVKDKCTERVNLELRRKTPKEIRQEQILEEKRRDPSLSGTVTDKQGKPVEKAKISNYFPHSSNPQQISYTDKDGKFYFKKHSGYVITAHKEGFAPFFHEFKEKYYKEYRLSGDWRRGPDIRGPIKIKVTLDVVELSLVRSYQ